MIIRFLDLDSYLDFGSCLDLVSCILEFYKVIRQYLL